MHDVLVAWSYASGERYETLSLSEHAHLRRIRNESDRRLQAASYALRRAVLSAESGVDAIDLHFDRTCRICGSQDHGRPCLQSPPASAIDFNVSHSGRVAAIAVGRNVPVGFDVESIVKITDAWPDIAATVNHPRDDPSLTAAEIWTAKEAVLKLTGHGLVLPMTSISVIRHGQDGEARSTDAAIPSPVHLQWVQLDAEHTAAVATARSVTMHVSRIPPAR